MTYAMIIASVFLMLLAIIMCAVFWHDVESGGGEDVKLCVWGIALGVAGLALSYYAGGMQ